ncbi:MAG: hypothetical protein HDR88_11610 [Bacteroides sp.]|nr:hypothetical protein [Bacteroides sp.]
MRIFYVIIFIIATFPVIAQGMSAYDIDQAIEICSTLPLDPLEGIWIYPEDNVTVLILKNNPTSISTLPNYSITVIESDDCRMMPGDKIGTITATAESLKYEINLFTERNKGILQKPNSCVASLSKDADSLILKGNKSKKLNLRLNLNISRLLPNFWRFVRISSSTGNNTSTATPPVGMVKIYPSYDGNGSSRRQPRYL